MRYWGKVLGLMLGLLSGAGLWGIVIGFFIGYAIDKILNQPRQGYFSDQQTRQSLFFRTTFQVMGHLTKSKGRVTDADIRMASQLMERMQLHGEARTAAQQAFREGKHVDYPLRRKLRELRSACFGRVDLIRMFLEIQIQAAYADGSLHPGERQVLYVIAEELGISYRQFAQFLRMMQSGQQFGSQHQSDWNRGSQHDYKQAQNQPTLADACRVLGVSSGADAITIKRAYRKLMSEHHPDKLVAKGLPPEMMEMAKQKTQNIQSAYDLIKREKNIK